MLIIQAKQGGDNCRQNQERPQAKYRTDFKNGLWSMVSCLIQPCVKCDKKKQNKKTPLTWDCIEVYCWFGGICLICPNAFGF